MNDNDYLNRLFEEAKQEPPLMDIKEVHSIIDGNTPAKVSSSKPLSKTLKIMLMTSISSGLLILLLLLKPDKELPAEQAKLSANESQIASTTPANNIDKSFQNTPEQPDELPIIFASSEGKKDGENQFMDLTDEELLKLHIKVKDGILEFKHQLSEEEKFSLRFTNDPHITHTTSAFREGARTAMTDIFPLRISDEEGESNVWFNFNKAEYERSWITDHYEDFIPVRIKLDKKGNDEYPNVVILWFTKNEVFMEAIPARERQRLIQDPYYYQFTPKEKPQIAETAKPKVEKLNIPKAEYTLLPADRGIEIDKAILTSLHFTVCDTGIAFSQEKSGWKGLVWEMHQNRDFHGRGDFSPDYDEPWKYPAFITSENAQMPNLYCNAATRTTKGQSHLTYFNAERDKLIPLVYDVANSSTFNIPVKNKWGAEKMIFWYYNSSQLAHILEPHQVTLPKETPLKPSPYFALRAEEWAALNVKMRDGIFEYLKEWKPNSFYRIRVTIPNFGSQTVKQGIPLTHRDPNAIYVPLGVSRHHGIDFQPFEGISLEEANTLLKEHKLVGFTSREIDDCFVWYKINPKLKSNLPERIIERLEEWNYELHYPFQFKKKVFSKQTTTVPEKNYSEEAAIRIDADMMNTLGYKVSGNVISLKGKTPHGKFKYSFDGVTTRTNFKDADSNKVRYKTKPQFIPVFINKGKYGPDACFSELIDGKEIGSPKAHFLANRHQYLPLVFPLSSSKSDEMVFWYHPSDDLLNTLGLNETEKTKLISSLKENKLTSTVLNTEGTPDYSFEELFETQPTGNGIRLLELDKKSLAQLGIEVTEKGIKHQRGKRTTVYNKEGSISAWTREKDGKKTSIEVHLPAHNDQARIQEEDDNKIPYPKFITDDIAQHWRTVTLSSDGSTPNNLDSISDWVRENITSSFLIPVLVKSGKDYAPVDKLRGKLRPDLIFWYEPNEFFLDKLPTDMAQEIEKEIVAIAQKEEIETPFQIDEKKLTALTPESKTPSCNYFEVCDNVKASITEYSVYPNPARSEINVELTASEDCSAVVVLTTINGSEVLRLNTVLEKNLVYKNRLDLSGLSEGIYLVNIQTSEGDKYTQRVIKVN